MKKFFILAICLPLFFSCCKVEDFTSTIYGGVFDAQTNEPIQGVLITLTPDLKNCYTGQDGTFQINNVQYPKDYTLQAQSDNYKADTKTISVSSSEPVAVIFSLQPKSK